MFEADASMLSLIGDGAIKLNQAIPGFMDRLTIRDMTGITGGAPIVVPDPEASNNENNSTRKISTYEITSLLEKWNKKTITKNNASLMLQKLGFTQEEAIKMLDDSDV